MKEMIYKYIDKPGYEILDEDYYKGYHYAIVSYFMHPCAYTELPKEHIY